MTIDWGTIKVDKEGDEKILEDILPPNYDYKVRLFMIEERSKTNNLTETKFKAKVDTNVCNEPALGEWILEYESITNTSHNQSHSDYRGKDGVVLGGFRKCQHNVRKHLHPETNEPRKDKSVGKNKECKAKVRFQLRSSPTHHHDEDCEHFSLTVTLEYCHGHRIESSGAKKYHPVSNNTKNRFIQYFEEGLSPSRAWRKNKQYLKSVYKEDYLNIKSNRSFAPDYKWTMNFHTKFLKDTYGTLNGPDSIKRATEHAQRYNEKNGAELCIVKQRPDGHYYVIIHDPMTLRVHATLPQAGDIVLVDSTGAVDRVNSKYFRFLTVSPAGALPLGAVITSSESKSVLKEAFALYRDTLPDEAFYKNGKYRGPSLFMSDDCESERSALQHVWPESRLLLCHFHLLQATWRWIHAGDHHIQDCDRQQLLQLFKAVVYASTSEQYAEARQNLYDDETIKKYPGYIHHLEIQYFARHEDWAMCVRNEEKLPTHNCNSNNYIEADM